MSAVSFKPLLIFRNAACIGPFCPLALVRVLFDGLGRVVLAHRLPPARFFVDEPYLRVQSVLRLLNPEVLFEARLHPGRRFLGGSMRSLLSTSVPRIPMPL